MYFRLFTLSQNKTNCKSLTNHTWKMSSHYLVQFHLTEGMLHSSKSWWLWKKAGCGLALVDLKRTGCDVWQRECQANNVTANVQSDHLLHGYMLVVVFATDQLMHRPPLSAEIQQKKMLPQLVRIADWYSIRELKGWKRWKICAFYKVVGWHFSGVVGKGVTVCFVVR